MFSNTYTEDIKRPRVTIYTDVLTFRYFVKTSLCVVCARVKNIDKLLSRNLTVNI